MPKLWNETIQAHRRDVHEAILDATWKLANERGPASVKMSEIADRTGIGRATLYKYFPDVDAILAAWHQRQIDRHLAELVQVREATDDPTRRLRAVFEAYAQIHHGRVQHHRHEPRGHELASLMHTDHQVIDATRRLHQFIRDLLAEAAQTNNIRDDVPLDELAAYCLHALTAAGGLTLDGARRLVTVTLDAVRAIPA